MQSKEFHDDDSRAVNGVILRVKIALYDSDEHTRRSDIESENRLVRL